MMNKKICHECGGKGYDNFDISEMGEDNNVIESCCDNCMGEGYVKVKHHSYIVMIERPHYLNYMLTIEESVNRPNNPEYQEIIHTWVKYNFGEDVKYITTDAEKNVMIDENWNIENYR